MKKSWWRRIALYLAYPKDWPRVFAFWAPRADEIIPPRIGVTIDSFPFWYRLEKGKLNAEQAERFKDAWKKRYTEHDILCSPAAAHRSAA